MARKMTGQERDDAEALRGVLVQELGPADRGYAPGIASALVRLPDGRATAKDVERILGKYKVSANALKKMMRAGVLVPCADEDDAYDVCVPAPAVTDAGESGAEVSDASPDDAGALAAQADDPAPEAAGDASGSREDGAPDAAPSDGPAEGEAEGDAGETACAADAPAPDAPDAGAEPASPIAAQTDAAAGEKDASAQPEAEGEADAAPSPEPADGTRSGRAARRGGARRREASRRDLKKVPYVRRGSESDAQARQRIVALDPRFWMNGWLLSHPGAFTMYERELTAINDVLTDGMLPGDITRRQLAYQMGGDEKFFEYGSDGFRLLRAMGMEDVVRHRPMPKPDLVYHAPRRRKHMRVLVTENLDPYLDVHDLMYEDGRTQILGERVHAVVLGGGTPVLEHNRLSLLLDTLGADSVEVLYWGDIDRAGVDLMMKLRAELGEKYKFSSFSPAYGLMVRRAMERFPDPTDNESTGQANIDVPDMSLVCEGMSAEEADYARTVVESCGLIPQEILTKRDL